MGRVLTACGLAALLIASVACALAADKPAAKPEKVFTLSDKWVVLVNPNAKIRGRRPLPDKGLIQNFPELKFTGPRPGHPFVLGDFADDGDFALVDGALQQANGASAVVQFPEADEFELEGVMEQTEFGGWFLAVGWADGRGYVLSNVTMRESGSPWFLTELRGGVAIPDGTEDLDHFEWPRLPQPFRLSVSNKELTFEVGKKTVADHCAMSNYEKGRVLLGAYDTRYGPKKLRILSLRMRSLAEPAEKKK
ncbi:MAG TPA: hypothetical protein VM452_07905 [Caulifigura sp.]|jgi:hypothetical protein|nr:hypothetical protein [Caulifigura sp.]